MDSSAIFILYFLLTTTSALSFSSVSRGRIIKPLLSVGHHDHRSSSLVLVRNFHQKQYLKNDVWNIKCKVQSNSGISSTSLSQSSSSSSSENLKSSGDAVDKQSMSAATFNLVKACVGAGVLSMPAGVAAIGDTPAAVIPAAVLIVSLGILSAYTFFNIGRICHVEGDVASLSEAWEKEFGARSTWLVTLCCFFTPLGAALSYSIVLGDMFSSLAAAAGLKGIWAARETSIIAVTLSTLYPLCSLQSLAALSPFSIVGVLGIILTCLFMTVRFFTGVYTLPSGYFLQSIGASLRPSFGEVGVKPLLSLSSLVIGSMTSTAFLCHFSAPDFYNSLKRNSVKRFSRFTLLGFGLTMFLTLYMTAIGFLTFGGNASSMILNNYSTKDVGATICRLLMAISLVGSYPFVFTAMRNSLLTFLSKGKEVSKSFNKKVTRILLAFITTLALLLKDAGFVVGLNGAIMGSAIIYIFPPLIFLRNTKRRLLSFNSGECEYYDKGDYEDGDIFFLNSKRMFFFERGVNKLLIAVGVLSGILGSVVSVLNTFYPHVLS